MSILVLAIQVYIYILIARVILSWIPQLRKNPVAQLVYTVTDPVLAPLKRVIPSLGGLDWSVFILIIALQYLQRFLS